MSKKKTLKRTHTIICGFQNEAIAVYNNEIEKELVHLYEEHYEGEFRTTEEAVKDFMKYVEVYPYSARIPFKLKVKQTHVVFK